MFYTVIDINRKTININPYTPVITLNIDLKKKIED